MQPFLVLFLALMPGLAKAPATAPATALASVRAQDQSCSELLAEILDAPHQARGELFEALGQKGDQEALSALKTAIKRITRPSVLALAVRAMRHFDADPYRRMEALLALNDLAWDRSDLFATDDPRLRDERARMVAREGSRLVTHAAARSLVHYGEHASRFLEEIVAEHKDPTMKQIAVGGLLNVLEGRGDKEALRILIDHYRPGLSGSFEQGVEAFSRFDPKISGKTLSKLVTDKRADDDLRAMALAALARRADAKDSRFDSLLRKQLSSDAPEVQQVALEIVGTRGVTGVEKDLRKLAGSSSTKSRATRHEALVALGRLLQSGKRDEELRELALESADSSRFEVRVAGAKLLAGLRERAARDRLLELILDDSPEVRAAVIAALQQQRFADAVPALIDRLESDSNRLRREAHLALQLLTGQDHGTAGPRWRHWWKGEGETFRLPPAEAAKKALQERTTRREESPTRSEFFGIPIRSDRVVFVLDRSGSMNDPSSRPGMTRFQMVRAEWIAAVRALPDDARSNLVLFADAAKIWQRELVSLEGAARARMLAMLGERPIETGATNIWAGLQLALRDPGVETVVILTDGQPTVGQHTSTRAILRALRGTLEMRQVVVHTISVVGHSSLLESIATQTGGEYREAR